MKQTFKKLILVGIVLSISTMSFAPFKDMRKGVKIDPERSEAQRAIDQQTLQGVQGEIAPPPVDTDTKSDVRYEGADVDGSGALAAAAEQDEQAESADKAKANLIQAEKDLQKQKGGFNWVIFGVIGALAGGIVFGVRQYANKVVPDMPSNHRGAKW